MKHHDFVSEIEATVNRPQRIGFLLLSGVGSGMWKAGDAIEQGVAETPALLLGAMYGIDVLLMVWIVYEMVTTGVRVGLRLWPRRKR